MDYDRSGDGSLSLQWEARGKVDTRVSNKKGFACLLHIYKAFDKAKVGIAVANLPKKSTVYHLSYYCRLCVTVVI